MGNISHANLLAIIAYDPTTGFLSWRGTHGRVKAGKKAGYLSPVEKRIKVRIFGHLYNAHRVIWFYVTGEWPPEMIDHINGDATDNRWCNLRLASATLNMQNVRRAKSNSTTGMLGVIASKGKYLARIRVDGSRLHLGTFPTPEAAHEAYMNAKRRLHQGCTI